MIHPMMAATLFLKMPLIGLQAQSQVAREVFPTTMTRGNYQTLGKAVFGFFSSLFKQPTTVNK
jgi:hypothetical protein